MSSPITSQQLWQAVLGELELLVSRANFTTWFNHTFISEMNEGKIIIGVPNTFTKSWLERKYQTAVLKALQNVATDPIKEVFFQVTTKPVSIRETEEPVMIKPLPRTNIPASAQGVQTPTAHGFNEKYRFHGFIVGKGNELAHAAAMAVANNPGQTYNPLFIYGGVGLGKTHLLHAIGLDLLGKGLRVLYITSERFTNDYIQAVRSGHGREFRDFYRSADVLLIDDIQFIAGKDGTQEEFFHTFNNFHQNNRQLVMTSDRPVKAIPALEERLRSRLEWGMTASVSQPDLETRIAILEAKCKERSFALEREVIQFLATMFQQNIRELEGALTRIIAECEFSRLKPSLEAIQNLFNSEQGAITQRSISPRRLIEAACRYYEISTEDLNGKSRKRELVIPRQVIMYLLREEAKSSFPAIGQEIGQRDHTTAMHAFEKIKDAIENDEKIRRDVFALRQQLYVR